MSYLQFLCPTGKDIDVMVEIERECFADPWHASDFKHAMQQEKQIAIIAKADDNILGYIFHFPRKKTLVLSNIAVAPRYRRKGVATQMVDFVTNKYLSQYTDMIAYVGEDSLDAQLFLREYGFVATAVLRDFFEHSKIANALMDAYLMRFVANGKRPSFIKRNRISPYIRSADETPDHQ